MEPGFAVNAETGLQPLLMGYNVKEVPISWINRNPDMGVSSFRLARVGGGYWRVLYRLWLNCILKRGPYRELNVDRGVRQTWRGEDAALSDLSEPAYREEAPSAGITPLP
jgi:hypothetical protein